MKNIKRNDLQKLMVDTPSVFHATMYPSQDRNGQAPPQSQIETNVRVLTGKKKTWTDE